MATADRTPGRWEHWLKRMHHPFRLRVGMTALVLVTGYLALYWPLTSQIEAFDNRCVQDQERLELAQKIEQLRTQYRAIAGRLPAGADTQELVNYLLTGIRGRPVRLALLKPVTTGSLGPYRTVALAMALEGNFHDLCEVLRWLETNQRLLRVDGVQIAPAKEGGLDMQLTVVGLTN